jgi:ATPase subunit of ABC transporter with duplicated ATPase domains
MLHMPIHIQGLALSFHDKVCIDDFRCSIHYGDRIAIVGRNGSGKSSLLQRLKQGLATGGSEVRHAADIHFAHVR